MRVLVVVAAVLLAGCAAGAASPMVEIPAGEWTMGDDAGRPDQRPARQVRLGPFAIDRTEVTNASYARFLAATGEPPPAYWPGGTYPAGAGSQPVVGVAWRQADAYCTWAGKRLPTEAEWERACRGPDGRAFPWGDRWDGSRANVTPVPLADPDDAWAWLAAPGTGPAAVFEVGHPAAGKSAEGVVNLSDNAAEWVADWYDRDAYSRLSAADPLGDGPEWDHVVRGGAWLFRFDDPALQIEHSRCAFRSASHSADDPRVGFRCARDIP